mmetsp:Transcript_108585/g.162435  ORF Transcript_108585/g.162435 Transcript_108585/m.162435 type:complete len:90 (+) Transcript_108585:207-476(+)
MVSVRSPNCVAVEGSGTGLCEMSPRDKDKREHQVLLLALLLLDDSATSQILYRIATFGDVPIDDTSISTFPSVFFPTSEAGIRSIEAVC